MVFIKVCRYNKAGILSDYFVYCIPVWRYTYILCYLEFAKTINKEIRFIFLMRTRSAQILII